MLSDGFFFVKLYQLPEIPLQTNIWLVNASVKNNEAGY